MTKADELYLRKFMEARENQEIAKVEETLGSKIRAAEAARYPNPFDDGKVNVTINNRLHIERQ